MGRIRDLPGLGQKSEDMLAQAGFYDVDEFLKTDPFIIYSRLKQSLPSVSLNFLYAIIGAQEGIPWQTIAKERKTEILMRLDDLGLAP